MTRTKEDLAAEDSLKIAAGIDSDMFEHLALLADDDALLPLPLDVDDRMNMEHAAAPLHGITDDAHGMRHLFARAHQELLAHELSDDRIVRSIGRHGIGEPFGTLGKIARDQVDEGVDVEPLGSGKHDHVEPQRSARARAQARRGRLW